MVHQFGNYLLDEEIARGGMARVYRARLRGLGGFEKTLVLKQVLPELASDPRFVQMFVEEAKTLVQMSHPHVVPVYELGMVDGVYFLAMEHVDGATLADVLRGGALATALVVHLGIQVCDALDYAHRRFELVHRDVTPRNVIIDSAGHVRLLDFGIAAPADEGRSEGQASSEVFGSPGYMSPEQARAQALTPQSDLFSLGCVLFEALTGERAFLCESAEQTRRALLEGDPPRLSDRTDVPAEVAEVVDATLAPEPAERPESASAVAKRLRGWLAANHPEGVGPELGARADAARTARQQQRQPSSEQPPPSEDREPSRVVRTLATSPALEAMLEGQPDGGAADPPATQQMDHAGSQTQQMDHAGSQTQQMDHAGSQTQPVTRKRDPTQSPATPPPGVEPSPAAASDAGPEPGTQPVARPAGGRWPALARRPWLMAALAAVGLTTAVVVAGTVSGGAGAGEKQTAPQSTGATTPGKQPAPVSRAESARSARPDPAGPEPSSPSAEPEPEARTDETADDPSTSAKPDPGRDEPPTARTTLTVNATPWAKVRLDGRNVGTTPQRRVRVPVGKHEIELECPPLGRSVRTSFEAQADTPVRVLADLSKDPPSITVR